MVKCGSSIEAIACQSNIHRCLIIQKGRDFKLRLKTNVTLLFDCIESSQQFTTIACNLPSNMVLNGLAESDGLAVSVSSYEITVRVSMLGLAIFIGVADS